MNQMTSIRQTGKLKIGREKGKKRGGKNNRKVLERRESVGRRGETEEGG
jgi:hypothetical protein